MDCQVSKSRRFLPIIDKISKQHFAWSVLNLSQPSKLNLVNIVLIAMICHVLSNFLLPVSISHKLHTLICSFLWASNGKKGIMGEKEDY